MNSAPRIFTSEFFNKQASKLKCFFQKISFPGATGLSFYEVSSMFYKGLSKGSLNIRATSIAFHFLLALGPAVIFLLGFLPYVPFSNFQVGMMDVIDDIIPENSFIMFESLLQEIFDKHHGLQIFGFLVTMFFIQKGLNGILEAFNATYHTVDARKWIERHMISLFLFFIFFMLVTLSAILLFFSNMGIKHLYESGVIRAQATVTMLLAGKWLIVCTVTFMVISFLYFLAPARKTKWRLFTPGSVLATLLSIVTSIIVSYIINHFAPFNRFYGSIGTLIAVMLWMNFNAMALLAGFELNASIKNARFRKLEPTVI